MALLAWKDAAVLDDINKIYTAKYNSDLEEDLLSVSDTKHHPVIQVRDGQGIFRNEKVGPIGEGPSSNFRSKSSIIGPHTIPA